MPTVKIELSEQDIKRALTEHVRRLWKQDSTITLHTTATGDCFDRPTGQMVTATVTLQPEAEGKD